MLVKTTFLHNVIVGLVLALMLVMPAGKALAVYDGAVIMDVNCDPGANINNDDRPYTTNDGTDEGKVGQFKDPNRKSCEGRNKDLTNYQVKVEYTFLGNTQDREITLGNNQEMHGTYFHFVFEGDKGCVYARPIGTLNFEVTDKDDGLYSLVEQETDQLDENGNVIMEEVPAQGGVTGIDRSMPRHCVPLPRPRDMLAPPDWGKYVSKACTHGCDTQDATDASGNVIQDASGNDIELKHCASKRSKPFTALVVQCVEDTINNLMFLGVDDSTNQTFFVNLQVGLRDSVRGLMALYIIFLGMQFIIRKQGVAQADWHWMALKIALVWYFAVGSGMMDLLPKLHSFSKGFSLMILESSLSDGNRATVEANVNTARDALDDAQNDLRQARETGADTTNLSRDVRVARTLLDEAEGQARAFGYNYCDFRSYSYAGYVDVDPASPAGVVNLRTRDMSYMRLWDMVDCKLSKYLGIGDNNANEDAPQVLLIAIASIFSTVFGIVIFILTLIYLVFVSLIAIRVVHIYLLAFIGLSLLVYMSPLLIPAALFNYTKSIFESWLKQIIAYTVQPMMLFAFLALVFAIFDHIIYEDNNEFYPMDWGNTYTAASGKTPVYDTAYPAIDTTTANGQAQKQAQAVLDRNKIILDSDGRCPDEDAMGCIYQKVSFSRTNALGFGDTFSFTAVNISYNEGKDIMLNLLKLVMICFILHAAAGVVESMATRLTNAAGGGAAGMSDMKTADPGTIAGKLGSGAVSVARKPGQVYGTGKRAVQARAGRKEARKEKRETKKRS